jgi:hypothetical protein
MHELDVGAGWPAVSAILSASRTRSVRMLVENGQPTTRRLKTSMTNEKTRPSQQRR